MHAKRAKPSARNTRQTERTSHAKSHCKYTTDVVLFSTHCNVREYKILIKIKLSVLKQSYSNSGPWRHSVAIILANNGDDCLTVNETQRH